jgi:hypothetical protein
MTRTPAGAARPVVAAVLVDESRSVIDTAAEGVPVEPSEPVAWMR